MCFWPPMSQTLSLKPLCCTDLMLKPCVGVMCDTSSCHDGGVARFEYAKREFARPQRGAAYAHDEMACACPSRRVAVYIRIGLNDGLASYMLTLLVLVGLTVWQRQAIERKTMVRRLAMGPRVVARPCSVSVCLSGAHNYSVPVAERRPPSLAPTQSNQADRKPISMP